MATYGIPYSDLYNPVVNEYTRFVSIGEMFEIGGINFDSPEEFKDIARARLDALARTETPFDSWQEFTAAAAKKRICQQLRSSR
ncbi:hypothetical protein [Lysobacter sp. CA199]|uniref:hypothetical protein n=1 Tax=Lysobacter sp. CA199 TaxID=3455608 RepID=UPI003F8D0EAF